MKFRNSEIIAVKVLNTKGIPEGYSGTFDAKQMDNAEWNTNRFTVANHERNKEEYCKLCELELSTEEWFENPDSTYWTSY